MNVLIACEFSGVVREAFAKKGHNAWSCDLIPTELPGQHYQGDVRDLLGEQWDLMIAHPPCTYLAVSGARWFISRQSEQQQAIEFFMLLAKADISKIVIENPIGIMSTYWRKPDQIIQPWQFGHGETKATCLWLKTAFIRCHRLQIVEKNAVVPTPELLRQWQINGGRKN